MTNADLSPQEVDQTSSTDHPNRRSDDPKELVPADFVCGVGASAGGLQPLEEFFAELPNDTGIGFVVVQHLSPDHETMMVELLARHTSLSVHQVVDGDVIGANRIYVIPPGTEMSVFGGRLRLRDRPPTSEGTWPISLFMSSLAAEYGDHAIAVVLSGTGTDGSDGVVAVRNAGGFTLAQDSSAAFTGMPDQARATGLVDASLSPIEMPSVIAEFARTRHRPNMVEPSGDAHTDILSMMSSDNGLDFQLYKHSTVNRRIERRVQLTNCESLDEYAEFLRKNREERQTLFEDLLIDVSGFFRDTEAFTILEQQVIPTLLAEAKDKGQPVRIWSAACSTGEEAYSLAMAFADVQAQMGDLAPSVQIFASDIHPASLRQAMAGVYSAKEMEAVDERRRDLYFTVTSEGYKVLPELRSTVTFSRHNLLTDAPFARLDLVTCRNMLIYLNQTAQEQVLSAISSGLRVNGYLFLGSSEGPGPLEPDLAEVSREWRIFRREGTSTIGRRQLPMGKLPLTSRTLIPTRSALPEQRLLRAYDAILEGHFVGAILVNESQELVHTFGTASKWMSPPAGRPSLDVLPMIVDPALRMAVSTILRALTDNDESVRSPTNVLTANGEVADLIGQRLDAGSNRYFLIYARPRENPSADVEMVPAAIGQADNGEVARLEAELAYTRESLRTAVEQQETSNEELNATNEELIAANEELQSTNEELSSVNEELRTVNDEHQRRLIEVRDLSADLDQLLNDSEIGAIFLDETLRVRRFSESARSYFRIRDSDLGRPLADLVSHLDVPDLIDIAKTVRDTGEPYTASVGVSTGGHELLSLRIATYRPSTDQQGVYVEFYDISELVQLEEQHTSFRRLLNRAPVALVGKTQDGEFWYQNELAEQLSHHDDDPGPGGLDLRSGISPDDLEVQKTQESSTTFEMATVEGRLRELLLLRFPLEDRGIGLVGIDLSGTDAGRELLREQSLRLAMASQLRTDILVDSGHGFVRAGANDVTIADAVVDETLDQVHPEDRDRVTAAFANLQLGNETTIDIRIGGGRSFRKVEAKFLRTATGQKTVLVTDRHDERQLVSRLESETERLRSSMELRSEAYEGNLEDLASRNADLDSFAHAAAHDLKAPVRAIVSFSEMAMRSVEEEHPAQEHLARVLTGSVRMDALVDSLLKLASAGRDELRTEACELGDILDQVVDDLDSEIAETGARLVIPELGTVRGDRTALVSVISNIVRNSLKYVEDRSPVVELEFETEDELGILKISDNGIGFDPMLAREIFEPFKRLHARDKFEGSGVGLAICKRLVLRLGGEIWARSRPGEGTEVSISLPVAVSDE